jgi:hypothetical protein
MDLTIEQFGYTEYQHWLQEDYAYISQTFPFASDGQHVHILSAAEEAGIIDDAGLESDEFVDHPHHRYWNDVKAIADHIFQNLDWNSLIHMGPSERESTINTLAVPRFKELTECLFFQRPCQSTPETGSQAPEAAAECAHSFQPSKRRKLDTNGTNV